jgi:SAM-dependent methyltransferase
MESDSGLLRWLKVPSLYNAFQAAVGATALRRRLIERYVRPRPGDKVIDIGCGPAPALEWLRDVDYVGLDINPECIALAHRTYGSRGTFVVGDAQSVQDDSRFRDADIVMAVGVLHHLDDQEAAYCVRFAYHALKEKGRFMSYDPCWIPNQGAISKHIMSMDRGRNIRTEQQYRQLVTDVFGNVDAWMDPKPLRIPYVSIVLECGK